VLRRERMLPTPIQRMGSNLVTRSAIGMSFHAAARTFRIFWRGGVGNLGLRAGVGPRKRAEVFYIFLLRCSMRRGGGGWDFGLYGKGMPDTETATTTLPGGGGSIGTGLPVDARALRITCLHGVRAYVHQLYVQGVCTLRGVLISINAHAPINARCGWVIRLIASLVVSRRAFH